MHGFIENVVQDLIRKKYPISDYTFILPNKRSGLFLKREISKASNKTIFSPIIYDIDEFMSLISGVEKVSDTELLFDFYKVYEETTNVDNKESFEEFISWGKTLIKDFNEIDRELCDTNSLFDYLEALKDLNHWSNYEKETELIKNYKSFWKKIKIYHKGLKDILLKKRKGYQGLIYKIASQEIQHYVENQKHKKHVFIGFNALSKSESEIIQEILENKLGEIYWDIDYKHVKSEQELVELMIQEPDWDMLSNNATVDMLFHLNGHYNIVSKLKPKTIEQLAAVLAIIRPAKRYLLNADWETITKEVWTKPSDGSYFFKKSHAVAYAQAIVVQMNILQNDKYNFDAQSKKT